jgi:monoamine oxidase
MSKDAQVYDVIIVGAGLSGLSAGYFLKEKYNNLNILIIEAKNRIGGRTHTIELKCDRDGRKSKWDAGGQWVSDSQPNVTKLLNKFGIETYKQQIDGKKVLEANKKLTIYKSSIPRISLFSLLDLNWIMTKFNIGAKRMNTIYPFENLSLANHLDSINLEQYLYSNSLSARARSIVEAAVRAIYGVESNQINALFGLMYGKSAGGTMEALALAEKNCAQEKRIKGGAQQLSDCLLNCILFDSSNPPPTRLSNNAALLMNRVLVEVNQTIKSQNDDKTCLCQVIVQNKQYNDTEKYLCKKLISSIPINQYVHVKFEPELPFYKRNLFKFCQFGNYIKVIVTYDRAFWKLNGFSGEVVSDGSFVYTNEELFNEEYNLDELSHASKLKSNKQMPRIGPFCCVFDATTHDNHAALLGFIAANAAVEWADQSATLRRQEVIEALVRYFGTEARDYVDYYEKNWNQEPYTGGKLLESLIKMASFN